MTEKPVEDPSGEDGSEDLAALLKQGYAGSAIDEDFSRELLLELEAALGETASPNRTDTGSAVRRKRWGVIAAGLAACATIGLACYFVVFYEPPLREPPPAARTATTGASRVQPQHVVLRGTVVDEDGHPAPTARVVNLGGGRVPGGVLSGADGTFDLPIRRPTIGYESVVAISMDGARIGIHNVAQTPGSTRPRTIPTPLRIVLKPVHLLRVRVRDALDTPVEDASVEFIHRSHLTAQAKTDSAGVATLRLPRDMENDWQVLAFKSQLGFDYEVFEKPAPGAGPREVDLVLDGARTVGIRAVGSGGEPLPDALFFLNRIHKSGKEGPIHLSTFAGERQSSLVRTGRDGFAVVDWLPPADRLVKLPGVRLDFPRTYYLPRHLERQVPRSGDSVEITLWRCAQASGVVLGANGRPAAGVLIRAEGASTVDPRTGRGVARTASDGSYTMRLAPKHFYMFVVVDDRWAAPARTGVLLEEDASRGGIDFRLAEGTVIHGTVTDRSSNPVAGQSVRLRHYGDGFPPGFSPGGRGLEATRQSLRLGTTTDARGRYAFRVGPGDYVISVGRQSEEIVVLSEKEIVLDFEV